MKVYLCNMANRFKNIWRRRSFYVIADPLDNSITFSKALFRHMDVTRCGEAKVFTFRVGDRYAFMTNPNIDVPTQLADIQYNSKHRCIGYECLVPTVNRIAYDYGLPAMMPCKLSVEACVNNDNKFYYVILPPHKQ